MDSIIEKINEYEDKELESLDWPYHGLLKKICTDIIEIIKED